jgi:hypothetical protein
MVVGRDVTARATIVASRDGPPSRVSISHGEARPTQGPHRVEVRWRARDGRALSCSWTFVSRP